MLGDIGVPLTTGGNSTQQWPDPFSREMPSSNKAFSSK